MAGVEGWPSFIFCSFTTTLLMYNYYFLLISDGDIWKRGRVVKKGESNEPHLSREEEEEEECTYIMIN